jgi:hypothetical protein
MIYKLPDGRTTTVKEDFEAAMEREALIQKAAASAAAEMGLDRIPDKVVDQFRPIAENIDAAFEKVTRRRNARSKS